MSPRTFIQILTIGSLLALVCACLTAAILVAEPAWLSLPGAATPIPKTVADQMTPRPTFTPTKDLPPATETPTPLPSAFPATATLTTLPPTNTPVIMDTPVVVEEPTATTGPLPTETALLLPPTLAPDPPPPSQAAVDFVVAQQRMRTNEENSWDGKLGDCGADHTIYVTVVDAAGNPLEGVIIGDTYDNVRASSGTAGLGKLTIKLWSNTMALEVQQDIQGTLYTSEQTLPLSTRDEDIPVEWLFAGGYCASMAECEMRQQANGLCRGHYSYDVTFQRTW